MVDPSVFVGCVHVSFTAARDRPSSGWYEVVVNAPNTGALGTAVSPAPPPPPATCVPRPPIPFVSAGTCESATAISPAPDSASTHGVKSIHVGEPPTVDGEIRNPTVYWSVTGPDTDSTRTAIGFNRRPRNGTSAAVSYSPESGSNTYTESPGAKSPATSKSATESRTPRRDPANKFRTDCAREAAFTELVSSTSSTIRVNFTAFPNASL